jgi:arginyl-tRNA synthetase
MPAIGDDLTTALHEALVAAGLPEPKKVEVTPATNREHGDFQSSVALGLQKQVGERATVIAARIARELEHDLPPHVERIEVAGPGFLNFFLSPTWLHDVLTAVVTAGEAYGRGNEYAAQRVNLEFVSVNPTGPLHAGGGRWVAVGDAIANLLAAQGAVVHREYYLNDAGNQLATFGASLNARYTGSPLPDDGYQGAYLIEMAERLRAERGDAVTEEEAREWGLHDVVEQLKADLGRIGVHFDTWFSERTLHEAGKVGRVLERLKADGITYEKDGAIWLRADDLGDQRDRVLVKSDGNPTYLLNDLAYHLDKVERGWDHLIDIWGADHHGQVKSVQVGMQALGVGTAEAPEPEVILGQFVTLVRDGVTVRLSKRTGNIITLSDILDEVDPDVARLTFLLQSIDTTQTFDLDIVTSQSMENPVYYVQYAHARVSSIARRAAERSVDRGPLDTADLSLLVHDRELDLLRSLAEYPEVLQRAAVVRAPHRVATWVREFASRFHGFYRDCRVITDDPGLTRARLWLTEACRVGLADALGILGVSAPEVMDRIEDPESTDENE